MLFATHVIHERRETLLHVICTRVKPRVCGVLFNELGSLSPGGGQYGLLTLWVRTVPQHGPSLPPGYPAFYYAL